MKLTSSRLGCDSTPKFRVSMILVDRDKWVPVTTAWRVRRLRMEEPPPIWRVASKILNKQPRTADKGWSSILGVGRVANNSSPQKVSGCEMFVQKASDLDWYFCTT
jgi:hypothetical protein